MSNLILYFLIQFAESNSKDSVVYVVDSCSHSKLLRTSTFFIS